MFNLWDINERAFRLFLAVSSQWRVIAAGRAGLMVWLGLDYQGVDVFMRRTQVDDLDGNLFRDLVAMEDAAIGAFAETVH